MPISQQGSVNTTSLIVPDLYVQIVAPQNLVLNGVPTDIVGVIGTASWGPVNEPPSLAPWPIMRSSSARSLPQI